MRNNNNNTVFNNISLQTEFFHLHQISYRGATYNLTKLVCKILMW